MGGKFSCTFKKFDLRKEQVNLLHLISMCVRKPWPNTKHFIMRYKYTS